MQCTRWVSDRIDPEPHKTPTHRVGALEGALDGAVVETTDGSTLGADVGIRDGALVGAVEGERVGAAVDPALWC